MTAQAEALTEFEPVMGLEVHCQLRTRSKAFCACPTRFGDAPNTNTCPTCLGLPGALPVFNETALDLALKLALATGCEIRPISIFARKNYFYADLPKGYQISQFDQPLAENGTVPISLPEGRSRTIRLKRIHLEEDAGKSVHDASETTSFVDFNRSGVPLAEIVSEPDFRTTEEVHAYLSGLRQTVRYLGVSDGNMEQGSLRCDVNISVRPRGEEALGTKVELKNLNSFRSVVRAIEHEVARQSAIVQQGGSVEHGTRSWDESAEVTRPLRSKELAHDYRYFPDPDLLPLEVTNERLERVREELPELPVAKRQRFVAALGLSDYEAGVLTSSRALADYYESLLALTADAKLAANWVLGEVMRHLKDRNADLEADAVEFPVSATQVAECMGLVARGEVSLSAARRALEALVGTQGMASSVVEELGLRQVSDEGALRTVIRGVFEANAKAVADFQAGNERSFGFLVGQVMKATKGQGNPQLVNRLLREELSRGMDDQARRS